MNAKQMLEKYISEHPFYWEFDNEVEEVERLQRLCNSTCIEPDIPTTQNNSQLRRCV